MNLLNLTNIHCCSMESYTVMNKNCNVNPCKFTANSLLVEQEQWLCASSDGIHNVPYLFGLLLQADGFILK